MLGIDGGRAECRIRKVPLPVVYVDFLSMYPIVNILLGLWDLLTAERVEVVECTDEARELLRGLSLDDCFEPARWREFGFFARIQPEGDSVPVRARYGTRGQDFTIGVNPL